MLRHWVGGSFLVMNMEVQESIHGEIMPPAAVNKGGRPVGFSREPDRLHQRNIARELASRPNNALFCLHNDMARWYGRSQYLFDQVEQFEKDELPELEEHHEYVDTKASKKAAAKRMARLQVYNRLQKQLGSASHHMRESAAELGSFTFGKVAQITHDGSVNQRITFVVIPEMEKL